MIIIIIIIRKVWIYLLGSQLLQQRAEAKVLTSNQIWIETEEDTKW